MNITYRAYLGQPPIDAFGGRKLSKLRITLALRADPQEVKTRFGIFSTLSGG
jgi:hypothetical protein